MTFLLFLLDYLPGELSWTSLDVQTQRSIIKNVLNFDVAAVLTLWFRYLFVNDHAFAINKINPKDFVFAINQVKSQMVVDNALKNFRCYIIKQNFQQIAQSWILLELILQVTVVEELWNFYTDNSVDLFIVFPSICILFSQVKSF